MDTNIEIIRDFLCKALHLSPPFEIQQSDWERMISHIVYTKDLGICANTSDPDAYGFGPKICSMSDKNAYDLTRNQWCSRILRAYGTALPAPMSNHDAYEFRPIRSLPAELPRFAVYLKKCAQKWSKSGKKPAYGSDEFWAFWIEHITAYAEVLYTRNMYKPSEKLTKALPSSIVFSGLEMHNVSVTWSLRVYTWYRLLRRSERAKSDLGGSHKLSNGEACFPIHRCKHWGPQCDLSPSENPVCRGLPRVAQNCRDQAHDCPKLPFVVIDLKNCELRQNVLGIDSSRRQTCLATSAKKVQRPDPESPFTRIIYGPLQVHAAGVQCWANLTGREILLFQTNVPDQCAESRLHRLACDHLKRVVLFMIRIQSCSETEFVPQIAATCWYEAGVGRRGFARLGGVGGEVALGIRIADLIIFWLRCVVA
ncbi:hypothetical protein R3P38DRAFT_2790751 [Favolaschia claudopus]|uniref:Uncharacterized protein n=1 Tax=Favolaschia claudopus TaxID=2862362 RepID=A0AAW0AHR6_9AGAR